MECVGCRKEKALSTMGIHKLELKFLLQRKEALVICQHLSALLQGCDSVTTPGRLKFLWVHSMT